MEAQSSTPCPYTVTVRRNPHRKARPTPSANALSRPPSNPDASEISSFPTEEILAMQLHQTLSTPSTENLRVFLRIRPLTVQGLGKCGSRGNQSSKLTAKIAWPQNPRAKIKKTKSKNSEICVAVNDSHSVTLSPPSHLKDLKRIKSEVYEGFSHVFSANCSQEEVYERMVNSLVEDFISGKSGMLAALGPSGSGKTHTVFGSPREPGMVPLSLKRIFKQTEGSGAEATRSFYLSMFEIYSERGKGERLLDLSPGGTDLFMQQSSIKGLQEVVISSAAQAESLIAQAMSKRSTAMTNSNSQSSRSQCIINIRSTPKNLDRDIDVQLNNAVLTIVDLAGAEREKRTGNQGPRLLESNFINNTSMVFGLCLRSLLEHQRNPKKPLQKHFQNSLLTRYLRDYLEGKKRMALILTIKPGEEDYLDTSFLLKQASPYMRIKFNNVEELSDLVSNKRQVKALPGSEQRKRMKFCHPDACATDKGDSLGDEQLLCASDEVVNPKQLKETGTVQVLVQTPKNAKLDANDSTFLKLNGVDFAKRERNNQIMQGLAKAIWNVLKQYKEKLEEAENQVQSLSECLRREKAKYIDLDKEMKDLKSHCSCCKEEVVETTSPDKNPNSKLTVDDSSQLEEHGSSNVDEAFEHGSTPKECESSGQQELDAILQVESSNMVDSSCLCIKDFQCQDSQILLDPWQMPTDVAVIPECNDGNLPDIESEINSCSKTSLDPQLMSKKDATNREVCYIGDVAESESEVYSCSKPFLDPQLMSKEAVEVAQVHADDVVESEEEVLSCSKPILDSQLMSKEAVEVAQVCDANDVVESEEVVLSCSKPFLDPQLMSKGSVGVAQVCDTDDVAESEAKVRSCSKSFLDPQLMCKEDVMCDTDDAAESEAVHSYSRPFLDPQLMCKEDVGVTLVCDTDDAAESEAEVPQIMSKEDLGVTQVCDTDNVVESEAEVHACSKPFLDPQLMSKEDVGVTQMCHTDAVAESETEVDSCSKLFLVPPLMPKEGSEVTQECNTRNVPESEPELSSCRKAVKPEKPRRRLMPASSMLLLSDTGALDLEDENQKPRGSRGGKKLAGDDINRTQGSIALMRLLKSNLRI